MKISNIDLSDKPLFLAPMAGVTDLTFRNICRDYGADVTCTEMVSAKALYYKNSKTKELLKKAEGESPIAVQLFGSEPELMANEALKLEEDFDIIDVNMGCPVAKIVGNGEGSALMKEPTLASKIIKTMADKLHKPVTVKIRKGFDEGSINAVSFAKMLEDSGASAISIHGRTRQQLYSGKADWNIIREVKESVNIPVIGNGDVFCADDARRMFEETGVDAVMIARGSEGNPWIFKEVKEGGYAPSINERYEVVMRHLYGLVEDKGEYLGIREMRKHLSWYSVGLKGSSSFRNMINEKDTLADLVSGIKEFFDKNQ